MSKEPSTKGLENKLGTAILRSQAAVDALSVEIGHLDDAGRIAGEIVAACNDRIGALKELRSKAFDLVADNARTTHRLEAVRDEYLTGQAPAEQNGGTK